MFITDSLFYLWPSNAHCPGLPGVLAVLLLWVCEFNRHITFCLSTTTGQDIIACLSIFFVFALQEIFTSSATLLSFCKWPGE